MLLLYYFILVTELAVVVSAYNYIYSIFLASFVCIN